VPIEWIDHIHRGGQHLLGLINDVLDLAKVEAGRLDLDRSPFDLRALVTETTSGLKPLAERKRLAVVVEGDVQWLVADRGRVRQVLYNLLSNAIKFTPEDGRIVLEMVSEPGIVRLSVSDNGPGISPEDQAVIFEEFRQVAGVARTGEGTGLGLALARRLVEAHGGRLELESEAGVGSRFTASFPQAETPTPEGESGRTAPELADRHPGPTAADILVIENDASTIRLLRTYLTTDGYTVRVAQDGLRGLAEARAHRPAAIILDIILPDSDGWEVLRELKADPGLRDVPVVIVTVVDERGLGLALGAVDYFLKPVDRRALLDRLGRYTLARDGAAPVRVLAVDDDPAALDLIDAALGPEGYDVVRADGGRAAVSLALSQPFDIVVCDLLMPDVDGFEVVAALKADSRTRELPILILTAHTLSQGEKARLGDQILGVVEKGDDALDGLRRWLARTTRPPDPTGADVPVTTP
jgi:CheY-like chemotaxis protein/anti-sigma regulatory factor (Ser/Thr protein kinase)